jgi:hypothetical protein
MTPLFYQALHHTAPHASQPTPHLPRPHSAVSPKALLPRSLTAPSTAARLPAAATRLQTPSPAVADVARWPTAAGNPRAGPLGRRGPPLQEEQQARPADHVRSRARGRAPVCSRSFPASKAAAARFAAALAARALPLALPARTWASCDTALPPRDPPRTLTSRGMRARAARPPRTLASRGMLAARVLPPFLPPHDRPRCAAWSSGSSSSPEDQSSMSAHSSSGTAGSRDEQRGVDQLRRLLQGHSQSPLLSYGPACL